MGTKHFKSVGIEVKIDFSVIREEESSTMKKISKEIYADLKKFAFLTDTAICNLCTQLSCQSFS